MEDSEEMAGDASNTPNTYNATLTNTQGSNKNETLHKGIDADLENNYMVKDKILRATSGNGRKQLGTRQETQAVIWAS